MENRQTICLTTEVDLTHQLRFHPDHGLVISPSVQAVGDDEEVIEPVRFEGLVDTFLAEKRAAGDYPLIYCMSHELRRKAEELHSIAAGMEDSLDVACDLYEVDRSKIGEQFSEPA